MTQLLFGIGGVPHSAKVRSTVSGIERIAELGLGCMELEFVQGVRMREATARQVAEVAKQAGVRLTAHAPYYINLNSHEIDKVRASQSRLLQTARIGALCGVESVVFHAAFYLGDPPEKTYAAVKKHLGEVLEQLRQENSRVWMRPEVMGKGSEFGTLEEILRLCSELDGLLPCIDFAHRHARAGEANDYDDFRGALEQVERSLGKTALDNLHLHVSGIAYGKKGEIKHLDLEEADLKYAELMRALKDSGAGGFVICESPSLEVDAMRLQAAYRAAGGVA